ncbi:sugar ABC transporter permease [Mumia sp. zg.B21]|uniref:carbohydrate ABC transporter permease n=1 Tax=Mumia sp. zg.B21 TaxID=2855447 RepID=UPI0027E2EA97|nr:sugar ABC transporter permease [Mumia sp. zg.B21]
MTVPAGPARSVGARPGGRRRHGPPGEPRAVAYLYILPGFVVLTLFLLAPLAYAVWLSFFAWDGLSPGTWVGLQNYADVLTDPTLRAPFGHALVLVVFFSLVPVLLGLLAASLLMRSTVRGRGVFQAVVFVPQVIALTVVAVAWKRILAPDGPLNEALRAIGLDGLTRGWLGDPDTALVAIGVVGTWLGTGLCTVLFLAGLSRVPRSIYDAARLDGAGFFRETFAISLPSLRNELAVALTLTMVAALRTFDLVYLMTSGGPGGASAVPAYEVYMKSMRQGEVGTGVTIALILAAFIMLLTVLVNRIPEREER